MENANPPSFAELLEKANKEQLLLLEKYADQLLQNERDVIKKAEDRSLSILPACGIAITIIGYIFTTRTGSSELSKLISIAAVMSSIAMIGKCIFYISKTIKPQQLPQMSLDFIERSAALTELSILREAIDTKRYLHEYYQSAAMEKMLYFDRALRSFVNLFPILCVEIFSIVINEQFKAFDTAITTHFYAWMIIISATAIFYVLFINKIEERIRKLWQPKNA